VVEGQQLERVSSPPDFIRRLRIAVANHAPQGAEPVEKGLWETIAKTERSLVEFGDWALEQGFTLPEQFPRSATVTQLTCFGGTLKAPVSGPCADPAVQALVKFASSSAMGIFSLVNSTWNEVQCREWRTFIDQHGLRLTLAFWATVAGPKAARRRGPTWRDEADADAVKAWAASNAAALAPFAELFAAYPGASARIPGPRSETALHEEHGVDEVPLKSWERARAYYSKYHDGAEVDLDWFKRLLKRLKAELHIQVQSAGRGSKVKILRSHLDRLPCPLSLHGDPAELCRTCRTRTASSASSATP
jgi:hypothetical protein